MSTSEKKWFVYVGDHHEGPFSFDEVAEKVGQGLVTAQSYGWCEGMADWKMVSDIPDLAAAAGASGGGVPPSSGTDGNTVMAGVDGTMMSFSSDGPAQADFGPAEIPAPESLGGPGPLGNDEKTGDLDPKARKAAEKEAKKRAKLEAKQAKAEEKLRAKEAKKKAKEAKALGLNAGGSMSSAVGGERFVPKLIKWLVLLLIVAGAAAAYIQGYLDPVLQSPAFKAGLQTARDFAQPHLITLVEKVPALSPYISPIPRPEDVSDEDFEDLKSGAIGKVDSTGAKVAVALGSSDPLNPQFYVASNLPDGAVFTVYLEGLPDTLLNQLSFNGKVTATVERRLGKSAPVKQADGRPLPRGEYAVIAVDADEQPAEIKTLLQAMQPSNAKLPAAAPKARRLVARKTYFLGGPKDAQYTQRLKEFHDRVKARATAELSELRQFTQTLESQLNGTMSSFARIRKGKVTKAQQKLWGAYHDQWMKLDAQIQASAQKWTPEALAKEYFYGMLYELVLKAEQAVQKAHGTQHGWFTGSVDPKAFDIQLGEAQSQAQFSVNALKAKLEQAAQLPPTPAGLPRKEGL